MNQRARTLAVGVLALAACPLFAETVHIGDQVFHLPSGFTVERAAASPLVDRPITIDFDEQGHLYVAESSGSIENVQEQLKKRPHRILRLEDSDGDGVFDRRTVFADKMMFPEGTMWLDGALWVSAPPSIWKLTDTDGDGIADKREEWLKQTLTGCANDLHGPYRGIDGRVYWCKGAFAEQKHKKFDGSGFVSRASHIFRARRDGSDIEPVMTGGMDNPVDVVFTESGERIFTTTFLQHPAGGQRDGLIHALYGGVYGKNHGVLDGHVRTGDLLPPLTHLGAAAPSGLARYRSASFGPAYRGNLFAALFNRHKVTRHLLKETGATYESVDSDFLVCESRDFHPTDVIEDADGSLLVVDTGGWYKLCCPTSQLYKPDVLGGIYRVRRIGAPVVNDARGLSLDWKSPNATSLAERLADARFAVRERAREALAAMKSRALPALEEIVNGHKRGSVRRDAVWTLSRIDSSGAREITRRALGDADATVRHAAAHVVGLWRDTQAVTALTSALMFEKNLGVTRAMVEALGRTGSEKTSLSLLRRTSRTMDRALEHSLLYAMIEIGEPELLLRNLTGKGALPPEFTPLSIKPPVHTKAELIVLDQLGKLGDVATLIAPAVIFEKNPIHSYAVELAKSRSDWAGQIADFVDKNRKLIPDDSYRALGELCVHQEFRDLVSRLGATEDFRLRQLSVMAMRFAPVDRVSSTWEKILATELRRNKVSRQLAIATITALPAPRGEAARALLEVANSTERSPLTRHLAVLAARSEAPMSDSHFELLLKDAQKNGSMSSLDSAALLGRATLDAEQRKSLFDTLQTFGPLELDRILGAFHGKLGEEFGPRIFESLGQIAAGQTVPDHRLLELVKNSDPARQAEAKAFIEVRKTKRQASAIDLEKLLAELPKGNIRRGQIVFEDKKTACSSCHAIGYLGGKIGPDLTRIGQVRSKRDLLESIVYPSASFVRSYETYTLRTNRNAVYSGVLHDEGRALRVVTSPTESRTVDRADVASLTRSETSIMPAGLTEQITRQQLSDLLAFLEATRWR